MCGSSAGRSRRRCRRRRSGRRPAVAATSTRTEPPRGVNLTALPTRLATTWPMRGGSWRMRIGARAGRRSSRCPRGAPASCCSSPISTAARRSSGRRSSRTRPGVELRELEQVLGEPVEPLDLAGARLEELGRASGSSAGALHEQLVERAQGGQRRPQLVRHVGQEVAAPVAVAADDLDALLEAVGHRVELDGELGRSRMSRRGPGEPARGGSGRPRRAPARPR